MVPPGGMESADILSLFACTELETLLRSDAMKAMAVKEVTDAVRGGQARLCGGATHVSCGVWGQAGFVSGVPGVNAMEAVPTAGSPLRPF